MAKVSAIRVIAKRAGRRRCGLRHSEEPTFYPAGHFTEGQLQQLKDDKLLVVDEMEIDEDRLAPRSGAGGEGGDATEAAGDRRGGKTAGGRKAG